MTLADKSIDDGPFSGTGTGDTLALVDSFLDFDTDHEYVMFGWEGQPGTVTLEASDTSDFTYWSELIPKTYDGTDYSIVLYKRDMSKVPLGGGHWNVAWTNNIPYCFMHFVFTGSNDNGAVGDAGIGPTSDPAESCGPAGFGYADSPALTHTGGPDTRFRLFMDYALPCGMFGQPSIFAANNKQAYIGGVDVSGVGWLVFTWGNATNDVAEIPEYSDFSYPV